MRRIPIVVMAFAFAACKERRQLAMAQGNAADFGRARCICEKLKKKEPPGDLTRCSDDMARATRYLKINMEFNSFNESEKQAIQKAGDEAFAKCMVE